MVLITVLNDGTLIFMAYDHVVASDRPEAWRLPEVFTVSITLGEPKPCEANFPQHARVAAAAKYRAHWCSSGSHTRPMSRVGISGLLLWRVCVSSLPPHRQVWWLWYRR